MTVSAILFDLDGTLVDSNESHVRVWARVFADAGHPIEPAAIRAQIGKGGDNLVPALLPELDEDAQQALTDRHGALFKADDLDRIRPFPAAHDLLRHAHDAGKQLVFASSASKAELDHYVALLDAGELLATSTCSEDAERSKPDPGIFAVALKKLGCPAETAMVVGDSPYDMEAAAKAGIAAVALLSGGFAADDLMRAGAIALYRDAADLLAQFDRSPLAG